MNYQCPICGYDRMQEPPKDFSICPCCGVEFGYDDFELSPADLRRQWIDSGLLWFSQYTSPPENWDAIAQLKSLGHEIIDETATHSEESNVVSYNPNKYPIYCDNVRYNYAS